MADIIERIRNLWNLAKNNSSAEESSLAAARAQELMFKYQIGEADLDVGDDGKREAEAVVDEAVLVGNSAERVAWKASLANSLGHGFGCRVYTDQSGEKCVYRAVGLKSAVQTIAYMYSCLESDIDRLADEAWKANEGSPFHSARVWKNNFRLGAVNTIYQRLKAQRTEQDAQVAAMVAAQRLAKAAADNAGVVALTLYKGDQERVADSYEEIRKKKGLRKIKRGSHRYSASAYERGQAAGRNVSLGGGKALGADKQRIRD